MDKSHKIVSFVGGRVQIVVGDLTQQKVDAVVNAANSTLLGGGVDGAIHDAGGPLILRECQEVRRILYPQGLPTGAAVLTGGGGNLPATHVIHTVGSIYGRNGGRDAELLAACYRSALKLAADEKLKSIAFPYHLNRSLQLPARESGGGRFGSG